MKTKSFTITPAGEIRECSRFEQATPRIEAHTKSEAQRIFLRRLEKISNANVTLRVQNGAYQIVYHDGEMYVSETGVLNRALPGESIISLCVANFSTQAQALEDSSFKYYASDEFRKAQPYQ